MTEGGAETAWAQWVFFFFFFFFFFNTFYFYNFVKKDSPISSCFTGDKYKVLIIKEHNGWLLGPLLYH